MKEQLPSNPADFLHCQRHDCQAMRLENKSLKARLASMTEQVMRTGAAYGTTVETSDQRWGGIEKLAEQRNAAMDEVERLRDALQKYGRHLGDGTMGGQCEGEYGALGLGPCTCGLHAALAGSSENGSGQ